MYGHTMTNVGDLFQATSYDGINCISYKRSTNLPKYLLNETIYPLTIIFNIYRTSTSGHGGIFALWTGNQVSTARQTGLASSRGGNNFILGEHLPGMSYSNSSQAVQINDYQWYNVICVVNGNSYKLYLDGELKKEITLSASIDNTTIQTLVFGHPYNTANNQLNGAIRKFMLLDKKLSQSEIQYYYNLTKVI